MRKNNKGFIQIILILIVVALVGGGMYYFGTLKNNSKVTETPTEEPVAQKTQKPGSPSVKPTADPTAGWKTYINTTNSFSIKYPSNWKTWSQGPVKDAWQEISSPDLAPKGSQEPLIGMSVSIRVFDVGHLAEKDDIINVLGDAGITGNYKVDITKEDLSAKIQGYTAITGEYEGVDPSYAWHFWSQAIAKGNSVILISITDFKQDSGLSTANVASEILSTFKFTK